MAGIGITATRSIEEIGAGIGVAHLGVVIIFETAVKHFRALRRWGEQLLHGAHRSVVQIRSARPNSLQVRRPIFSCATKSFLRRCLVAGAFEFSQEFIESGSLLLGEELCAKRIGADFSNGIEAIVAFG